jgi:PAS domain S-box-containing protein
MTTATAISEQLATVLVTHKTTITKYVEELATLRSLLNVCPLPMFLTDSTGGMVYVNQAYLHMLGAKQEDITGAGWLDFVHQDDRKKMIVDWKHIIAQGKARFEGMIRYVRMDGDVLFTKISICRIFGGNYSGFIVQPGAVPS